jgi:hypothetical protein
LDDFARERFLDAVVIVNDLERAEVELANVRGGEGILAAALAAKRFVLSTNTDTLIDKFKTVNRQFFGYFAGKL